MSDDRLSPCRDEAREVAWLEDAAGRAGAQGFVAHALRRLAAGQELYGTRCVQLGLERLIGELDEEAVGVGAVSVFALQALDHELELSNAHRDLIAAALEASLLWAALTYRALELARDQLDAEGSG